MWTPITGGCKGSMEGDRSRIRHREPVMNSRKSEAAYPRGTAGQTKAAQRGAAGVSLLEIDHAKSAQPLLMIRRRSRNRKSAGADKESRPERGGPKYNFRKT